jgi:hypothetical protein
MGDSRFWSRLLAIASFAGTALISGWLIEGAVSERGSDWVYFVVAPLLPVLFAAAGLAGTLLENRTGQMLVWAGAMGLTVFFVAPGMIGPLYTPAALLMLIAAVLKRRAAGLSNSVSS